MNGKTRKNNNINIEKYIMNMYSQKLNSIIFNNIKNNIELNDTILNFKLENYNNIKNTLHTIEIKVDKYIFTCLEDEDLTNYTYYFTSKNTAEPCIVIYVPKDKSSKAHIEKLFYDKGCSYSEHELEEKSGTIIMLKTALSYIIDKFKSIRTFTLTDITTKKGLWITPRRLLLGNKGWYEEYFKAVPTPETKRIIDIINNNRVLLDTLLPKNNYAWWTDMNILKCTMKVDKNYLTNNILKTSWLIHKKEIESYYIPYEILN